MQVEPESVLQIRSSHSDKRIVFTTGVFDLLHAGHIGFLKGLSAFGDIVVVCVTSDEWVKSYKTPDRPIFSEQERVLSVDSLRCVDYTILAKESGGTARIRVTDLLTKLRPDVFVTSDPIWEERKEELESAGITLCIVPRFNANNISTTAIINRIRGVEL